MIAVCPRCDCALVILSWGGMDVDVCPTCRGLWLDQGELEELLDRTRARVDDPLLAFQRAVGHSSASKRAHLCPRCDHRLREVEAVCGRSDSAPVHVDRCPRGHGLWFDKGELSAILQSFPPECDTGGTIELLGELLGAAIRNKEF